MSSTLHFLFIGCLVYAVQSASIFDAFSSSVGSLFQEQEEAPFTLLSKAEGFEEREYGPLKWVCSVASDIKSTTTKSQADTFLKLFDYLEKQNSAGEKIEMAIPVSIHYKKDSTMPSAQLSACFYIGGTFQQNPPSPLNANLTVTETPTMTIYTRKFGGVADRPSVWLTEAKALKTLVEQAGKTTQKGQMFWNAFDSPVKFWNRRNEVWLVKE